MRYILDTCTFLWLAEGNSLLSVKARKIIEDPANDGAISTISIWEMTMKSVVGKLPLSMTPIQLGNLAIQQGLTLLPLTLAHVDRFHRLPTAHRDPFDRLLASVTLAEESVFLSPDVELDALGIKRIW